MLLVLLKARSLLQTSSSLGTSSLDRMLEMFPVVLESLDHHVKEQEHLARPTLLVARPSVSHRQGFKIDSNVSMAFV